MTDALLTRGVEVIKELRCSAPSTARSQARPGESDFTREFEELARTLLLRRGMGTRFSSCRGTLRSMITIAMLVAQGRSHEVKVHVQGAINNGVTTEQIREILIHAVIYCGIPAAVEGFRNASEVLDAVEARTG